MLAFAPAKFVREVRAEMAKVTWPSRKETLITTGLVLAMSALAAVFFLLVDQLVALAMRGVFGLGLFLLPRKPVTFGVSLTRCQASSDICIFTST